MQCCLPSGRRRSVTLCVVVTSEQRGREHGRGTRLPCPLPPASKTVSFVPLKPQKMLRPHFSLILATFAIVCGALTPASAQTMKSGDVAVLASYYEIRGADCLALRAPRVQITQPPQLGKASIVHTRGQSAQSGRCAYKAVPIAQVVYQADRPGSDVLSWEVKYQNKTLGTRRYSATVGVTPAR